MWILEKQKIQAQSAWGSLVSRPFFFHSIFSFSSVSPSFYGSVTPTWPLITQATSSEVVFAASCLHGGCSQSLFPTPLPDPLSRFFNLTRTLPSVFLGEEGILLWLLLGLLFLNSICNASLLVTQETLLRTVWLLAALTLGWVWLWFICVSFLLLFSIPPRWPELSACAAIQSSSWGLQGRKQFSRPPPGPPAQLPQQKTGKTLVSQQGLSSAADHSASGARRATEVDCIFVVPQEILSVTGCLVSSLGRWGSGEALELRVRLGSAGRMLDLVSPWELSSGPARNKFKGLQGQCEVG